MVTIQEVLADITATRHDYEVELEALRAKYVGRGGQVERLLGDLTGLSPAERSAAGAEINALVRGIQGS